MKLTKNFANNVLQGLTDNEVATYILIKSHYDNIILKEDERVIIQTTLSGLYYELAGTLDIPRKLEVNLVEGLKGLVKRNVVAIVDSDSKNGKVNKSTVMALDVTNLWIDTKKENYVQVTYDELVKVFEYDTKNKFGLLRFTCIVLGTLNNEKEKDCYKCGWYSIKKLQEMSKISSHATVDKMLGILEKLEILYIHHSEDVKTDTDGQIKNLPNVYSRPNDKDKADKYYDSMVGRQAYDFTKQLDTKARRAISTDYNRFLKGKYTGDLKELIKECIAYNEQPYYEEKNWGKDMSVFDVKLVAEVETELEALAQERKEIRQEAKQKAKAKKTEPKPKTKGKGGYTIDVEAYKAINKRIEENKKREQFKEENGFYPDEDPLLLMRQQKQEVPVEEEEDDWGFPIGNAAKIGNPILPDCNKRSSFDLEDDLPF